MLPFNPSTQTDPASALTAFRRLGESGPVETMGEMYCGHAGLEWLVEKVEINHDERSGLT